MSVARVWLTMATLLLATTPSFADDILGTWLRDDGTVRVKFEPCDNTICGNIVWLKSDSNSKAKIGQRLFFDMHSDGTNAWTGKAVSPGSSSVYSGKMSIARSTLNTSGCIVGELICKSANWTKLQ